MRVFRVYSLQIERWCPPLPWRKVTTKEEEERPKVSYGVFYRSSPHFLSGFVRRSADSYQLNFGGVTDSIVLFNISGAILFW